MNEDSFDEAGFAAWAAGDPRRQSVFDTMWNRIMEPAMGSAISAYKPPRRSSRASAVAAGATALMLLFGGYQLMPTVELYLASPQTFVADNGAIREVRLDDGTLLTLANGADVAIRYTGHEREMVLRRGTVFANVTRDAQRPFRITAGDGQITVLGTRFEVVLKPAVVRVAVEQGQVRFARNSWFGVSVDLGVAEAASLTPESLDVAPEAAPGQGTARWRKEWVEYENAPMRQVVADLESLSPVPIVIRDNQLAERRVSGRIRLTDPVRQIDNLSAVHAFSVHRTDDLITLSVN